jgi:ribonucleotide reductase alpha subunit
MIVIKRDGKPEPVSFDKIKRRIETIKNLNPPLTHVDEVLVSQKVIAALHSGISTSQLDTETVNVAKPMSTEHYEYGDLASRIAVSNFHKNSARDVAAFLGKPIEKIESALFLNVVEALSRNVGMDGDPAPRVSSQFLRFARENSEWVESVIDYSRDYQFDVSGFSLLQEKYLLRASKFNESGEFETIVAERPQHMIMRVAIAIHSEDRREIEKSYQLMSQLYFTHATPTLFNAGTTRPQLSSCFLTMPPSDSITGIYDWYKNTATISKWAGGIGSHVHNLRARGSYIKGTGGVGSGIVPWLKTLSESSAAVNQGGKRPGSHAVYLEPWHADFLEFVSLRKQRGSESERAKKLFYGAWLNDEFMRAVENDKEWYFMCPNVSKGLADVFDREWSREWVTDERVRLAPERFEFTALYRRYVREGKTKAAMPARAVWAEICESLIETGGPYMMLKDSCNRKSNQQNLGVIKSSNLCTEIVEFSSPESSISKS